MHRVSAELPKSPLARRFASGALSQLVFSPPSLEKKSQSPSVEAENARPVHAVLGISASVQVRCRIVRQLTAEMVMLVSERVQLRRDRRRTSCHVRQIAMYICHVILQMSLTDIGTAFGRDRTTVGHACNVIEDRRDDKAYDEFVAAIERVVISVFGATGNCDHD